MTALRTCMAATISFSPVPTYVYKFLDTGETVEVQQSFADETLTEAVHPRTGATMAVKKVFQPVGVTFKGDGFYKTDNRGTSKAGAAAGGESSSSDASGGTTGSRSGSGDKKTADTPSTTSSKESKPSSTSSSETKSTGGSSKSTGGSSKSTGGSSTTKPASG